jgi:hypothetical protein
VFRSASHFAFSLFRTQLFSAADMPQVAALQDAYRLQPLSAFLGQPAPAPAATIDFPKVDRELAKKNFFDYLDFALQFIPPSAAEKPLRARLASIGIGPDKRFAFSELPWTHRLAVLWGMRQGSRHIDQALEKMGNNINGWQIGALSGGADANLTGDWLTRAMVTRAGIYALDAEEAVYPLTRALADGTPLDTGKHAYRLTFQADELPPAQAFWSITLYDAESQFLVRNPLDRYLINSSMLPQLQSNADGSITLYIQQHSPGAALESNWLPGPDGPIYLVMRLYWPRLQAPSVLPAGKGSWQPPALQLAPRG